ncbi:acyl-CoA dehydrogenase family protein [Streptomyces sp. NPDC058867]|uniref:acyl-CoA dehydrogenase family protein n=1 Tax=unclassified Streptomyces TaxID=2593676 RepID=UPI0036768242
MSESTYATIDQPDSALRPEDLVARARSLREHLRQEQDATDERGTYSPETHELFRSAGFYRTLLPRRFGGYEFDIPTFLRVMVEVARGCPGSGWNLCLASGHAIQLAGIFEESAQERAAADGNFAAPFRPMLTGTATRVEGQGWRIEGKWEYCSGSPYSTHAMVGVRLMDNGTQAGEGLALLPRDGWILLDDWRERAFGMRGSGSNSITTADGGTVIPDDFLLQGRLREFKGGRDTAGYRVHGNPMYAGKPDGYLQLEIVSVIVGCAYAALDEYERIIRTKKSVGSQPVPRFHTQQYQRYWGLAAGKIRAAEDILMHMAEHYMRLCQEAVDDTTPQDVKDDAERVMVIAVATHHAVELAWEAVELMFRTSGTSEGGRNGTRMQRYYRDMSTARTNAGLQYETFAHMFAQLHFGLPVVDSFV